MQIAIPAETLEASLNTLRGFVHKAGSDTSMLTMTAVHITADKNTGTITLVGNNPSQKLSFPVKADVEESGETLVSVADTLTALSTIADKSQVIKVGLVDNALAIHSKTVSVNVPVFDVKATHRPRSPKVNEGTLVSLAVPAESLPTAFARALPGSQGSQFPKMLMWVESGEFCLMTMSAQGASFASVSGAEVTGSADLALWDPANLKRIVGLAANAESITIKQDSGKDGEPTAHLTITVIAKDTTFVVEQTMEQVQPNYAQARAKLMERSRMVLAKAKTQVTIKAADIVRAMESAEKVRAIGRDRASSETTRLDVAESLLTIGLLDDSFSEEIGSAKTGGALPLTVDANATVALGLLSSLGADAKVTLHLPEVDASGRVDFALLTCQDSDLNTKVKGVPASGYWGIISLRAPKR